MRFDGKSTGLFSDEEPKKKRKEELRLLKISIIDYSI